LDSAIHPSSTKTANVNANLNATSSPNAIPMIEISIRNRNPTRNQIVILMRIGSDFYCIVHVHDHDRHGDHVDHPDACHLCAGPEHLGADHVKGVVDHAAAVASDVVVVAERVVVVALVQPVVAVVAI